MKKRQMILLALSLAVSTTAISGTAFADSDYSGQTITAQVTSIDGTTYELQLGELAQPGGGDQPSDMQKPDDNGEASSESGDQTPPEKPDGESSDSGEAPSDAGEAQDGEAPSDAGEAPDGEAPSDAGEAPDGEKSDGQPSDMQKPDGDGGMGMSMFTAGDETASLDFSDAAVVVEEASETTEGSLEDIEVDSILEIEFDEDGNISLITVVSAEQGGMGGPGGDGGSGAPGGFGGSSEVTQGDAANTIDEDGTYSDETYTSTGDDENALRVDGASVTLDGITVEKTDGATSNTENGDFYGMNAALLATDGAEVTITNAEVTSSAQNGNGVFSYGDGTVVNISDSTITTTADNSGGIQTTGGGTTNASNLTVETSGNSSAAIRSDRGGGTVNVDGGTYTSNGYNSPAVYSTAAITVSNAELTANNSEALVIEGDNSIILTDCTVSGKMSDTEGTSSDENVHNVMIYQSMSGDAEVGTSEFSMTGGSLTSNNGDLFYITNTDCVLELSGVDIINNDEDGYLLRVTGNSASRGWGTAGSNGAQVAFTADAQVLEGDIIVDSISTLDMTLTGNSSFTGTLNIVDNEEGGTAVDNNAVVTIEEGSTWTLTGDCTITSLTNNGTINYNGYTITLADGTVLSE